MVNRSRTSGVSAGSGTVLGAVLIRSVLPDRHDEPGRCRICGYDLRGSVEAKRCPECGCRFDPHHLSGELCVGM